FLSFFLPLSFNFFHLSLPPCIISFYFYLPPQLSSLCIRNNKRFAVFQSTIVRGGAGTNIAAPAAIVSLAFIVMADKGRPLPKFGEWDVNDPSSSEGFTVIFNKARDEKKSGGKSDSPANAKSNTKHRQQQSATLGKPQSKKWLCCIQVVASD
ncbi:unnamed protein product, partial [Linum tenue]